MSVFVALNTHLVRGDADANLTQTQVSGVAGNVDGVIRLGRSLTLRDALRVCRRVSPLCDTAVDSHAAAHHRSALSPALREAVLKEAMDCLVGGVTAGPARERLVAALAEACGVGADRANHYDTLHKPSVRVVHSNLVDDRACRRPRRREFVCVWRGAASAAVLPLPKIWLSLSTSHRVEARAEPIGGRRTTSLCSQQTLKYQSMHVRRPISYF